MEAVGCLAPCSRPARASPPLRLLNHFIGVVSYHQPPPRPSLRRMLWKTSRPRIFVIRTYDSKCAAGKGSDASARRERREEKKKTEMRKNREGGMGVDCHAQTAEIQRLGPGLQETPCQRSIARTAHPAKQWVGHTHSIGVWRAGPCMQASRSNAEAQGRVAAEVRAFFRKGVVIFNEKRPVASIFLALIRREGRAGGRAGGRSGRQAARP